MKYQIFGSADSLDVDILVFVDNIGTKEHSKKIIREFESKLQPKFKRDVNCNIGVLHNGVLTDVYKGTTDEVNNSLFYTYKLHKQPKHNFIKKTLVRDFDLKAIRVARIMLSFLSRTQHRKIVKVALKQHFSKQLECLLSIDFSHKLIFNKPNQTETDIYKTFVFQLAQILASLKGIEVYTKNDAKAFLNCTLADCALDRELSYYVNTILNIYKDFFCNTYLNREYNYLHNLTELTYERRD